MLGQLIVTGIDWVFVVEALVAHNVHQRSVPELPFRSAEVLPYISTLENSLLWLFVTLTVYVASLSTASG